MNKSFLDLVGLTYLWGKIKEYVASYSSLTTNSGTVTVNIGGNSSVVPTKTSLMTNDSGFITLADVPKGATASSSTPLMDGTATVGTETAFARGDHRHPSDTSKQDVIDASHKLSADLVEDGTANKVYTAAEKDKLGGIAAGAEVNVQANWTETSTSSDAYIKNKPTLATVATSGSYDDLSNKPSIPDDSDLVHKTGTETISGDKIFTNNIKFHGTAIGEVLFDNDNYTDSKIRLKDDRNEGWVQIVKGSGTTATTLQAALDAKQDSITSTSKLSADLISDGTTNKAYTATEKTKLSGIASGAEVNQNAFSNIKVGTTTVAADTKTDTIEFVAGSNITLTPDATSDKITIAAASVTPASAAPLMDGTATVGTSAKYAREDHKHPSDTSKQDVISDLATIRSGAAAGATAYQKPSIGIPATDLASAVQTSLGKADSAMQSSDLPVATTTTPKMDGTAAVGTETKWAKGDHVHPTDTSRAADNSVVHNTGNEYISGNKTIIADGKITLQDGFNQIYDADDKEYLGAVLNKKAPLASPALTGTPTAPTATAGTNTTQIATTAFVTAAVSAASAGVASFQGTVSAASTITGSAYKKGWYWVVETAGTYVGQTCEVGDMIFAIKDKGSAYAANDFSVVQNNMDIREMTTTEMDTVTNNWT